MKLTYGCMGDNGKGPGGAPTLTVGWLGMKQWIPI